MVAEDQLVARVGVLGQHPVEPGGLDPTLAAESGPERVDEDRQQVAPPHEVAQALLPGRSVARQVGQHLAEDRLAAGIVGRVVAGRVVNGDRLPVEPRHLVVEEVAPLGAQRVVVGRQADHLVAGEQDQLGPRPQPRDDGVHGRERCLVGRPGHARAGVAVADELVPGRAPREQGGDDIRQSARPTRWIHGAVTSWRPNGAGCRQIVAAELMS